MKNLAAAAPFAPDDTSNRYLPDATFRTRHLRLELTVDMAAETLSGWCHTTMELFGPPSVELDAVAMTIQAVRIGRRAVPFRHDGKVLHIDLPKADRPGTEVVLSVQYSTQRPAAGIRFVQEPSQAYTQGQSDDTRYWVPCRDVPDERATLEMAVTVPEDYRATSNGALLEEKHDARRRQRTFHWKTAHPVALYLLTLTVGRFAEVREKWRNIPVTYLCERGREADARRGFGKTPQMLEFFSTRLGVPYPWEKYAQVAVADYFGGMENTSATTQTDRALLDKEVFHDMDMDDLVAHELAHQWFGDLVTCYDWGHAWLNESFATYMELLFQREDKGAEEFEFRLWRDANAYFDEQTSDYTRPTVTRQWRQSMHLFDRHLYQRGACFLHFLHHQLGEEAWWRALQHYLETQQHRSVQTGDLIEAIREATGRNVEKWFDEWLFRAGHPDLHVTYARTGKTIRLWVVQKDKKTLYTLPLEFRFVSSRGRSVSFTETISQREHLFEYKVDFEPSLFLIDPELGVPVKKLNVVKPRAMWVAELTGHPGPVGRIQAAQAVASWGTAEATALLQKAFAKEGFWGVQLEIAKLLPRLPGGEAALIGFLSASHPKVRRGVVDAFGDVRSARAVELLAPVFKKDRSIFVRAAALSAMARSGQDGVDAFIQEALQQPSWSETLRQAAVRALARTEGLSALEPYAQPGHPSLVRAAAIAAIGELRRGDPGVLSMLEGFTADISMPVRRAAIHELGNSAMPQAYAILQRLVDAPIDSMTRAVADRAARLLRQGLDGDFPT